MLPFRVTKEQAVENLKAHYQGKFFLPKLYKAENTLREIKGVYVPFWLFDGEAVGEGIYSTTRDDISYCGDTMITDTYAYQVRRAGTVKFEKIPVDASSKMDNSYMDSIEPYDYSALQPFAMSYLSGVLADKYDVSVEACAVHGDERAKKTASMSMYNSASAGYDSCSTVEETIILRRGKVHYGLLSVWMLSTEWAGKRYLFAVNGQTRKTVGDLPIDKWKVARTFAAIAGALIAVGSAAIALLL